MNLNVEDVNRLDVNKQKCYYLLYNARLTPGARVLISWQDEFLIDLLRQICADIRIDCLMEMDFSAFLQEIDYNELVIYDYVIDNGLLAQTNFDTQLLRAMGMHLAPSGVLRTSIPLHKERNEIGKIFYANNFEVSKLLSTTEAGDESFYVVEFSLFNQGVAWLQSFYTSEVRKKLAYLLLRLDFGFDVDNTVAAVRQLCLANNIAREYLAVMIDIATIHKQRVKLSLALQ